MIHKIWLSFILAAFIATCAQALTGAGSAGFEQVMTAVSSMAGLSVDIAIGLIGVLAFWLGIFEVAEKSGMIQKFARILSPLLCRIMPQIPRDHPALGSITMNLSANVMGLDNAATPFGIRAMQDMQKLKSDWSVRPCHDILNLPGVGLCVADLCFEHPKKNKVYLEVMGYWSRQAVWKRVELAEAGLANPMVFAVSERLRISEAVLGENDSAALYVYKGVVVTKKLLEKVDALGHRPSPRD